MEGISKEERKYLVVLLFFATIIVILLFNFKNMDRTFERPYSVKIKNDHELQLINKKDTIRLYLENAYGVEEEIVFVRKR